MLLCHCVTELPCTGEVGRWAEGQGVNTKSGASMLKTENYSQCGGSQNTGSFRWSRGVNRRNGSTAFRLMSCRTDKFCGYWLPEQSQHDSKDPQTCSTFDQTTVWSERPFSPKTPSELCNKYTHSSCHTLYSSELLSCQNPECIKPSASCHPQPNAKWTGGKRTCQRWSVVCMRGLRVWWKKKLQIFCSVALVRI